MNKIFFYSLFFRNFINIERSNISVENLEPGTKYVYRVGDASTGIWSNNGTFETACDGEEPCSFIALADVQAGNEINFTKSGAVQRTAMQVCPDAKFLMNAGDFVNDCNDQDEC